MNKGEVSSYRKSLGRMLLSYGVVLCIGLWLGYRFASTERTVTPERKEMSESIAKMGDEDQGNGEGTDGNDRAGEESTSRGEMVQEDDLSLTFYETLLKKGPSPKMQGEGDISKGIQASRGQGKRERPSKEDKSSKRVLSGVAPFSIQVGSFAIKKQAEDLKRRLEGKGYPAYITSKIISGMGRMYQVRIGHYRTLDEAKREAKLIGNKEKLPTYIPSSPDR